MVKLKQRESFALMKLVEAEFTSSGLSEPEFAASARTKLNNPDINTNHVQNIRIALGIDPNRKTGQPGNTLVDLIGQVKGLEEMILQQSLRVDELERKVVALQRDFHLHPAIPPLAGKRGG